MKVRLKSKRAVQGFTLLELLVTLSLSLVLMMVIFVDTARGRERSLQMQCLKNLRQLQFAVAQYAEDHDGDLPEHEGAEVHGQWLTVRGWITGNAKLNGTLDTLTGGTLYPYVQRLEVYHCPADKSELVNVSKRRLRSYSLNLYVATRYPDLASGPPKLSEFSAPDRQFSFIDEEEVSINDGAFAVRPRWQLLWWDIPADRHNEGGTLSFVDGHAEYWKWRAPKPGLPRGGVPVNADDAADLRRLQEAAVNP